MGSLLTIAGFDPSSGAGITADLAVFAAHGLFGTSAITALTVQSTVGVRGVHPVDGWVLRETLEVLEEDLPADGIKIGMLGTAAGVEIVAEFVERLHKRGRRPVVVLDPVVRSSSGRAMLDDAGLAMMQDRLLPLVNWATPNVEELGFLGEVGKRLADWRTRDGITSAGRTLQGRYAGLGLVITGGDLEPPDDLLLGAEGETPLWLRGERVETRATHGTGCAFSSALLCRLVRGDDAAEAARGAKEYVAEAMRRATPRGRGRGRGPMELLWCLRRD